MKIGIYGGTFDPIHRGHITAAQAAAQQLGLDLLLLIPASIPPHKALPEGGADAAQRLEMATLATAELSCPAQVLDVEVRRQGKSYTADTLRTLRRQYPEDELWLLMGTDMFLSLQDWHEPQEILRLVRVAAFSRTGDPEQQRFARQRAYLEKTFGAQVTVVENPHVVDISSTRLRQLLPEGREYLPEAVGMIFRYAFVPNAIIGGSLGYALKMAVSQGVKRGLFSNEAGMGSTPHAHAMAKVKRPHEQGVVAMTGVFIDTFVVLTMTALVVISTLYAGNGILSAGAAEGVSKANMAQLAFGTVLGSRAGSMFVAVCLLFFAFSTILSWNFFGRLNVSWLLGEKAVGVYSVLAIGFIFLGSCLSNDLVWELADLFNQLMVLPNVLALVTLGGLVAAACRRK